MTSLLPNLSLASTSHAPRLSDAERLPMLAPMNATGLELRDQYEPSSATSWRSYRACGGPLAIAATNTLLAVGAFTTVTGWLVKSTAYKIAGPIALAAGTSGAAWRLATTQQSPGQRLGDAIAMTGITAGASMYQMFLLGAGPLVGSIGLAMLLAGGGHQVIRLGVDLARADAHGERLPFSNGQIARWLLPMTAAGLAAVIGGSWVGAMGLYTKHETARIAGETAMGLGTVFLSLTTGLAGGRLLPEQNTRLVY